MLRAGARRSGHRHAPRPLASTSHAESPRTTSRLTTGIEDLSEALRASARGLYGAEAAVRLLIGHLSWLLRADFVGVFVETGEGFDGTPMAWVDWSGVVAALDAGRLPCSPSEGRVLRVAASLAEGIPVDMREAVSGLDGTNIVLIAQAVVHAGGHRDCVVALSGAEGR